MTSLIHVSGSLVVRERIALPPGAVATVKVVDAEGEVLAATALEVDQAPVTWSVAIDPALVGDSDRLLVWAMLRTEVGVWGTLDLAPASADETVLVRVDLG